MRWVVHGCGGTKFWARIFYGGSFGLEALGFEGLDFVYVSRDNLIIYSS